MTRRTALPVEVVQAVVERMLSYDPTYDPDSFEGDQVADTRDGPLTRLAFNLGVTYRTLYAIRTGERSTVQFETVDTMISTFGRPDWAYEEPLAEWYEEVLRVIECKHCGVEFSPRNKGQAYCCQMCWQKARGVIARQKAA